MSIIRQIDLAEDLPMLKKWWEGHKAVVVHEDFLPDGWLISSGGIDIAALFLYLDRNGKFAMVEYMTTNPSIAFSRHLVDDIRELIAHVENVARAQGCKVITSMVAPGSSEDRLYQRIGYKPVGGPAHVMFCKPLYVKEPAPCLS